MSALSGNCVAAVRFGSPAGRFQIATMKASLPILAGAFSLLMAYPVTAALTETVWQGASGANWTANGNWSAGAPNNTRLGVANNTLGGGSQLIINSSLVVGGLQIAPGFTLTRAGDDTSLRRITLDASTASDSTLNNAGTISSGGNGGSLRLKFNHLGTSYVNSGILEATAGSALWLEDSGTSSDFLLDNTGGIIRTVGNGALYFPEASPRTWVIKGGQILNPSGTIHLASGRGVLELQGVTFNNGGTMSMVQTADYNNIYYLRIINGSSFTNSGLFEVVNDWGFNTNNRMPRIEIGAASDTLPVAFTNSGTIRVTARGVKEQAGNTDTGFLIQKTATIENTGTIELIAAADLSGPAFNQLNLSGNTLTLQGSGELVLDDRTANPTSHVRITGGADSHLINTGGHTIRGGGALGNASLATLTNHATIEADASRVMEINLRSTDSVLTNTGLLHVSGAGGMVLVKGILTSSGEIRVAKGSAFTINNGTITSSGLLNVNGTLESAVPITLSAGELRGSGTVTGNLEVTGPLVIAPLADGAASLNVDGNLTFANAPSTRVVSLLYADATASLNITGDLDIGTNHAFEFTLQHGGGWQAQTVYSLIAVDGSQNLDLGTLSLSEASLDAGFLLDTTFGTNGWNLNGGALELRLRAVPEGQTWAMLGFGLAVLVFFRHRRSRLAA